MPDDYELDYGYGYDDEYEETDYGYYTRRVNKAPSFLDYDYVEGEIYEDDYYGSGNDGDQEQFISDWF